jgi:xanthine permease
MSQIALGRTVGAPVPAARPHPVDEVLPTERLAVYGFQHVLAFYAGAVVVPILLAGAIGLSNDQLVRLINADLFTCGIASIIQSVGVWKIGVRLPLIQGVTFTAVAPMIAIGLANGGGVSGLQAIYGAVIVAGVVTFLLAPYTGRLLHLFPPVVTGTVITVIGVTLVPVAALEAGGGNPTAPDFGSLQNIAFAGGTLLVILLIYRFFRGFLSTIAVLLGLIIGTAAAAAFGLVDFAGVQRADWVGVTTPFYFGVPTFGPAAVISMIVVMLITAVETTGDVFAAAEIVGKRVGREDVSRAIRADGLATTLGGILNSFPYTCFAENVGLVRLTRVKSRYVVATAGAIMVVIGLIPKIGAVVAAVPHAVLGGAALILCSRGGPARGPAADPRTGEPPGSAGVRRGLRPPVPRRDLAGRGGLAQAAGQQPGRSASRVPGGHLPRPARAPARAHGQLSQPGPSGGDGRRCRESGSVDRRVREHQARGDRRRTEPGVGA